LLGRGSVYTLATAAPALSGLLILPVTTRILSQQAYGLVAVCLVVIQFGTILAASGLALSITRHALLERTALEGARGLVFASIGTAGLVTLVVLATGTWWSEPALGQAWGTALVIAVLAAGASALVANVQAYLRAVNRAWTYVLLASGGTLLGPALGIVSILVFEPSALAYVSGVALAYCGAAFAGLTLVAGTGVPRVNLGELRSALRVGIPTVPHQLALSLAVGAMILITSQRLGLESSARLQVALLVGMIPTFVTASLNNAWVPIVMRAAPETRIATLSMTSRDVGWIAAAGSAGVSLLSPWILEIVAPSSYGRDELVPVVALASIVAILSVLYLASSHLVFISGRTSGFALISPFSVACGMGVAIVLVNEWGLLGASAGFVATYAVLAIMTGLLSRRVSTQHWVPWPLLAPVVFAVAGGVLGALLPDTGSGVAARIGLAAVAAATGVVRLSRILRAR
jgi:O-antigen/teichoic acid export membrane protein